MYQDYLGQPSLYNPNDVAWDAVHEIGVYP